MAQMMVPQYDSVPFQTVVESHLSRMVVSIISKHPYLSIKATVYRYLVGVVVVLERESNMAMAVLLLNKESTSFESLYRQNNGIHHRPG